MIGIYGIWGNNANLTAESRREAFSKMSENVDSRDFNNKCFDGHRFSIGVTCRNLGENKDLALKIIGDDTVIAFCGYAKFSTERRLHWADVMTERILSKVKEGNFDILQRLEGSFQCLLISKDVLIIVSDRFGSKNIFYHNDHDYFIFAPDVSRILSSGLIPRKKNLCAAMQILVSGFFLDDSTLVENILRFPYATVMTKDIFMTSGANFKRYWNLPAKEGDISVITPDLIEEFNKILMQAINELADLEHRFIVPLSGGLDSRTIACYLYHHNNTINTITYDSKDEISIAQQVCGKIGASSLYFSNEMICSNSFSENLLETFKEQKIHTVMNQYFYLPLFKNYFAEHQDSKALFNGVYMDELFSSLTPKYDSTPYDLNKYIMTYGGKYLSIVINYLSMHEYEFRNLMETIYNKIIRGFGNCDDYAKYQLFYFSGRLRRYVNETVTAMENYCYVFKPGYNYDLVDFGFKLNSRLRGGILYWQLLSQKFPSIMEVKYKDSYGNRPIYLSEKLRALSAAITQKLSLATRGAVKFTPYQIHYYFSKSSHMREYENLFYQDNVIHELINDKARTDLLQMVKTKYYFFEFFQRLLFLQQFYYRHDFQRDQH